MPLVSAFACGNGDDELLLGATTSVQDTGLLDALIADFEDASGYEVKPIVQGSGQVLELARRGELDVIQAHSPAAEEKLIAAGFGVERVVFMQNFFLIAGPADDPAGVGEAPDLREAFRRIAESGQTFVSRGDGSGTHERELAIWQDAGIDPAREAWYQESAIGQGQNLLVANERRAYTLVDSATLAVFRSRVQLTELLRDTERPNVYSVITLDKDKLPEANVMAGQAFADYVTSQRGQRLIAEFGRAEYGQSLFQPRVLN